MGFLMGGILFLYTWKKHAKTQQFELQSNNQNESQIVFCPQNKKQLVWLLWLRIILEDSENISPNELNG